jgi:hypothetical protein
MDIVTSGAESTRVRECVFGEIFEQLLDKTVFYFFSYIWFEH